MNNEYVFSDDSKFAAGSPWSCAAADIVANFPACKMLLHEDDVTTGDTAWVDRVAGLSIPASGGLTVGSYGVWGTLQTITGAMPVIGDLYPLLVWNGRAVNAVSAVRIGETSTGAGIDLQGNNLGYVCADVANYVSVNSLAPTFPFDGTMSIYADTDATNEVYKQYVNAAGSSVTTANKTGADGGTGVNATFETLVGNVDIPTANTSGVKLLALFCFAVPPTSAEVSAAMKWMAANEGKLYPGFAGKT